MEQIIVTHVGGSTLKLQSKDNVSNITKAVQTVEKLGADTVDISVVSATKLVFSIGDKITIFGRDYTLNTPANEKKLSESNFSYDLHFEGVQYDLLRASYSVNVDTTNGKVQDLNGDSLTGDIKMFLDVLVANANRVFPGKWSIGTYPSGTDTRTETFNDTDNCLSVLQSLCSEDKYNTEFSIAIGVDGARTINIGATGKTHTYTFEYGKGKGLNELVREKQSSSNIITRLNVFGSSRNINTAKYRAFRLCLPGKTKSQSFLENADSIAAYGVWEGTKPFEDIYPHRTGVISAIGSSELVFTDSSMDFDLNEKEGDATKYLISGSSAKVHFNSGALAGYEFDLTSYNHATKVFTVKPITDENGYTFPSPTTSAFKFAVGDKYVLLDIYLPQSYIDAAESELAVKGQEYLDKYSQPLVQYGLTLDSFFLRDVVGEEAESNIIWPGDYIPIKDTDLNVDKLIRVKGISRNLLADYDYNITISDLGTKVSTITSIITSIGGIDKLIQMNGLNDPARARRNYLSAQEVLGMIFDTEGDFYTDKIKPLSIETSMLSVGAKSMQFDLTGTVFQPNYGGNKNRVVYVGGVLNHSEILDESNNPRIWNIADGDIVLSTDAAYYIYAKCVKVGTGASLLFSTSKITVESDPNYYHFLVGIANSVNPQNARSLALMYGFSNTNGRFITTGRIQSGDGVTYFDLDTGEMQGKITFKAGSSGYANLADKPDLSVFSERTYVDAIKNNLQSQIDGTITSWFFDYEPTLANVPATNWGDSSVMEIHLGDLFYWTSKGYAYRFQKIGSVFSWNRIADTDVTLALANAAKAQDTADGKRRVFVAQPTAPYDKGDLWAKGTAILKCDVPKVEGQSFSESDWSVTATDDTAVNNLQIGGRNLIINSKGEFTGSSQVYSFVIINQALSNVAGKTFTLSAEARVTEAGNDTRVLLVANDASWLILNKSAQSSVNNTSWEHISVTFTVPYDFSGDVIIGAYNFPNANSGSVALRYLKLEEGSKATGWTPAPEDVAADIAIATTAAAEAISAIEGMGEDGLITPFEKKTLRQMVNQMLPEFNELIGQADNYNVDSEIFSDAYADLLSFTDPLLSDMSATSLVDRTLLEQLFSNYNTSKINLLSAISNAINGTATTALTQASAVFPSDANLLAHWSFDEVSDMPDGVAAYRSRDKWSIGTDGWTGNSGVTVTTESGNLKVVGTNNNGASITRTWVEDYRVKSLIIKVRSAQPIVNVRYYNGTGVVEANAIIVDQYNWIARFDNIQVNNFGRLYLYVNHGMLNQTAWIDYIYIGDGSYASKISDNSGNGRALINQGALAVSTGISGKSLSFNGASHAEVDSSDFRNAKFTISAWFKSPGMGVGQSIGGIVCITYMVRLELNANGTISFFGSGSNGGVINGQANLFGGWHHVAAVYTGTQIALYVDGSLIGLTQAVVSWDHSNPLYIGTDPNPNNSPLHFNGLIDEVRVYNRNLSGAEVLGLYKYITKGKAFAIDLEANYLKEALQGSTEISGGLTATNLLLLKDALGAITGGMSGLASDNTGFWTGGTYEQALSALAKIIFRKDGSGQLAGGKILFDALGALMVGAFTIENGNIKGYADNKEKIKLHTGTIDTIAVMDSAQWQPSGLNFTLTNHFSGIIYDRTGIGGGTNKFVTVSTTKTITITESTVLRFISNGVNVRYDPTGDAYLFNYTERYEIVGVASNIAPSAAGVTQNVAAGTYQIVYSLIISSSTADGYDHDVVVTNNTIVEIQQGIERTEIGKNGLLSYFGSNNFFHFSQLTGLQMRGTTNMPGILATGSVTSGASHVNKWGAKTSGNSVTKGGTGIFIVPHSVGSITFTAIATCTATGYYAAVTAKANGSITVTVKSYGGSVSDQPFDYVIMGAN